MKIEQTLGRLVIAPLVGGLVQRQPTRRMSWSIQAKAKRKWKPPPFKIGTLRTNIFLMLSLLDRARNAETPQARKALYEQFDLQFMNMIERVNVTAERARAMKQRGDAYFADWEGRTAEITDPEKRQSAESRYKVRKRS